MGNGREWGEISAAILHQTVCHSQLPSLWRQNTGWMLHPHTLPAAAGQCYSYIIALRPHTPGPVDPSWTDGHCRRSDGWTARYATSVVGCVWEVEGRADARASGRISLQSPLVSPTTPPLSHVAATHGVLSGAGTQTDGWAAALAGRRRSTADEDDAAVVLRTVPRCT